MATDTLGKFLGVFTLKKPAVSTTVSYRNATDIFGKN